MKATPVGFPRVRLFCGLGAILALLVSTSAQSQDFKGAPDIENRNAFIDIDFTGSGAGLKVKRFSVSPLVDDLTRDDLWTMDQVRRNSMLQNIVDGQSARIDAAAVKKNRDEWLYWTGLEFGAASATGTFAEQAMQIGGLSDVNAVFTELGLAFTLYQVALAIDAGDNQAAAINAYKGLQGYAVGKWGWRSLQISGVVLFLVDVTLTEFGTAAWTEREKAWREIYRQYYREGDATAASRRETGYLTPTFEERVREIRSRREAGRTKDDWRRLMVYYYRNMKRPENFGAVVEKEVRDYAGQFWTSAMFDEIVASPDSGQAGLARGASLTDDIRSRLVEEHRNAIMAMLIRDVFPEIKFEAFRRELRREVDVLNDKVRPILNDTLELELSVYGQEGPLGCTLLRHDGNMLATGTLPPGVGRVVQVTKLAATQDGVLDRVRMELPGGGAAELPIRFTQDRATLVFGEPHAPAISVFSRTETDLACTLHRKRLWETEWKQIGTETRPPPGKGPLHVATRPDGTVLMGNYSDGAGWSVASPGINEAGRNSFGFPRFENIRKLDWAGAKRAGDLLAQAYSDQKVTIERLFKSRDKHHARVATRCTSTADLRMIGAYGMVQGQWRYTPLDLGALEGQHRKALDAVRRMQNPQGMP